MAKRKTKKENVVDLSQPKTIEDKELERLQTAFKTIHQLQSGIGELETQKHGFLHALMNTQQSIAEMQKEFQEKYGTFDINIKDGTINYNLNGEADKKD